MDRFVTGAKPITKKKGDGDSNDGGGKQAKLLPWIEKYRPTRVSEVAYQDEVTAVLQKIISGSDVPNLLFYGPPGTGKTSAIIAAARQMFGDAYYRDKILELNASDERGIQVIRDKVKLFAQLTASGTRPDGKACPPIRLIILDEADSMTNPAQAALRRTMERHSKTTRFCLICNYISRIIEPLTSRCAKFRFKPLAVQVQKERLRMICSAESVNICDAAMDSLIDVCEGDLRKSITFLQTAATFKRGEEINMDDVALMTGVIPDECIQSILDTANNGSYDRMDDTVREILREGHAVYQMLSQLVDLVTTHDKLTDLSKAIICETIALCEKRLLDGADEYLQLLHLACVIMKQFKNITPDG